jgi:hypothetical protein
MRNITRPLLLSLAVAACTSPIDDGGDPNRYPNTDPNPPMITGVVAGNAQITVSFTLGSATGSGSITQHAVTCKPATGNGNGNSGSASPIVVTGLTNGTEYTCTAVAIQSNPFIGTSTVSKPSNAMTATPVAPPSNN